MLKAWSSYMPGHKGKLKPRNSYVFSSLGFIYFFVNLKIEINGIIIDSV